MSFALGDPNFTIAASSGNLTKQADGSYIAIWILGATIWGQGFNADGSHKDGQFQIASGGTGYADVSATLLSTGETIVTWVEGGSVKAQRIGADHASIGVVQDLGSPNVLDQHAPEVYDIGNGDYSVLYKGVDGFDLLAQTTVIGQSVTKSDFASAEDFDHAFTALTNGTLIVLYHAGTHIQLEDENNGALKSIVRRTRMRQKTIRLLLWPTENSSSLGKIPSWQVAVRSSRSRCSTPIAIQSGRR